MKLLLERGAEVKTPNEDKWTAFHFAAQGGERSGGQQDGCSRGCVVVHINVPFSSGRQIDKTVASNYSMYTCGG